MIWLWIGLGTIALLLIAWLAAGFALFRYLCVPPKKSGSAAPEGDRSLHAYTPYIRERALQIAAQTHELVTVRSFDGLTLRAKLYPNEKEDRIVILVHGYHSSASWDFGASFDLYRRAGYTVLAVDDRAHGSSDGKYIGFGALDQRDVRAWMDWAVSRFGAHCRIALAGVSMGAATVLLTCGNYPIEQLVCAVADCGYTVVNEVVLQVILRRGYPGRILVPAASLWCRMLAGYRFRQTSALDAMRRTHTPTLFLHGTADTFVPFEMMERLYEACAAQKEKEAFLDAVHGESSYKYPEQYESVVVPFLARYLDEDGFGKESFSGA